MYPDRVEDFAFVLGVPALFKGYHEPPILFSWELEEFMVEE
jgi:hypothetical protein